MARPKGRRSKKDSVSGFFRPILQEKPELLEPKRNKELLEMWKAAHPNQPEIPKKVSSNLANLKSQLRRHGREEHGGGRKKAVVKDVNTTSRRGLDALEEAIDDCVIMAANIDRKGLETVIKHLRHARNDVVIKHG